MARQIASEAVLKLRGGSDEPPPKDNQKVTRVSHLIDRYVEAQRVRDDRWRTHQRRQSREPVPQPKKGWMIGPDSLRSYLKNAEAIRAGVGAYAWDATEACAARALKAAASQFEKERDGGKVGDHTYNERIKAAEHLARWAHA